MRTLALGGAIQLLKSLKLVHYKHPTQFTPSSSIEFVSQFGWAGTVGTRLFLSTYQKPNTLLTVKVRWLSFSVVNVSSVGGVWKPMAPSNSPPAMAASHKHWQRVRMLLNWLVSQSWLAHWSRYRQQWNRENLMSWLSSRKLGEIVLTRLRLKSWASLALSLYAAGGSSCTHKKSISGLCLMHICYTLGIFVC